MTTAGLVCDCMSYGDAVILGGALVIFCLAVASILARWP
jgi:hypothetical protein